MFLSLMKIIVLVSTTEAFVPSGTPDSHFRKIGVKSAQCRILYRPFVVDPLTPNHDPLEINKFMSATFGEYSAKDNPAVLHLNQAHSGIIAKVGIVHSGDLVRVLSRDDLSGNSLELRLDPVHSHPIHSASQILKLLEVPAPYR
jgi:hypothetical protein